MKNIVITESLYNKLHSNSVIFERSFGFTLPLNSCFEAPCNLKRVDCEAKLTIGAFSYCVSGYLFGANIGRYCSLGEGIQIGRHSHPLSFGSTSPLFYNQTNAVFGNHFTSSHLFNDFEFTKEPSKFQETYIGNDVYIGHEALIMPGIKIGNGAVIGARSVVTKNVPDYAIVAGSPATIRRYRFSDILINELLESKWWEYSPGQLKNVSSDKPESFIEEINNLRREDTKKYNPDQIHLVDFRD